MNVEAAPARTAATLLFTGKKVPSDDLEYLVTTYLDDDGEVIDQTVATRPAGSGLSWEPAAYLDPAPGTDPSTGRVREAPC